MPTTLLTAMTSEAIATTLADRLMEGEHHLPLAAAGAFEQEPPFWRFEAWFTEAPDMGDVMLTIRAILGNAAATLRFDQKAVDDTDWVAKALEDLPPVRAGRFVVHGEHDRHKVRANEVALEIEASLAFGTGHHGTTHGCLAAVETLTRLARAAHRKGKRRTRNAPHLLDVGTGTGVLALAYAKALKRPVIAGDLDVEAVRIARENAKRAGAGPLARIVEARGVAHPVIRAASPYPIVITNILAGPLVMLAGDIANATAPGGTLILSGLLAWQARRVSGAYLARGFVIKRRHRIGDWMTLTFAKAK